MATTSDSVLNIGDQIALECTVSLVPYLIVEPTLEWLDPVGNILASTTGVSLTHSVTVEGTSAAGVYECVVMVDVVDIGLSISEQSSTSITVQSKFHLKAMKILHCKFFFNPQCLHLRLILTFLY